MPHTPARAGITLLASLVAPPRCGVCAASCERDAAVCERCDKELAAARPVRFSVPGVDDAWSAAPYEGAARGLVVALKFGGLLALAPRAAAAIAHGAPPEMLQGSVVPVPPAPLRARIRGHDPAEEIAAALAARAGLALAPCLARTQGPRQVGRPRSERMAAPPRVRLRAPAPAAAILLDDVTTTGATLGACAAALRDGGCRRVVAVSLARSL